jgi:hypothetical protein
MISRLLIGMTALLLSAVGAHAGERVLDGRLHHLRQGAEREWSDFPEQAEGTSLELRFTAEANASEQTLRLRQQDIKQTWKLMLNGQERGRLLPDENDMVVYFALPPGALRNGENTLRIEQVGKNADDVRVGEIVLDDRPRSKVLSEATLQVVVADAEDPDHALPCRITVLNAQGALMSVGAQSGGELAVRPGVVYTGSGRATFGLPAGKYTIYAGRGFAYGIDSTSLVLREGETVQKTLSIRREVKLPGFVSCDTHVHTLTFSGHGDATIDERMLTLAGEDIELPIATDHNVHIDFQAAALRQKVRTYFTPVIGNEVTSAVGHFCVFPVREQAPPPDYQRKDWPTLFDSIEKAGAKVVILNHPRDIHLGFRPFGPKHFNAATGEHLDGWALRANAVELINSGALQSDFMQTYHDWFALLNRGTLLTPIGSSDSHDVARYIVGQGRTYVRTSGNDPGKIDAKEAVTNLLAGRVYVSLGLLADISINNKFGPGELVPPSEEVMVRVRVLGPSWVTADRVELFANGHKIREMRIADGTRPGVKWTSEWTLPRFRHDVHLVAIASGPGVRALYWPIAKPYQPTSRVVNSRVVGSTGAVWIDGDGDGKRTSAREYAERLVGANGKEVEKLIPTLAEYDQAVAVHAAALLQSRGVAIEGPEVAASVKKAGAHVADGFRHYFEAWRQCEIARGQKP